MGATSRPADPATLTSVECTGCQWALIGDGLEAAQLVLRAAEDHCALTGHELTTLGLVPGNGTAADVLAALMPETATAFTGGWVVSKDGQNG